MINSTFGLRPHPLFKATPAVLSLLLVSCGSGIAIDPSLSSSQTPGSNSTLSDWITEHRYHDKGLTNGRTVPVVAKDSDGLYDSNVELVDHSVLTACGTTQASVAARITDCAANNGAAATWRGTEKSNSAHGVWKLVTKTANGSAGREVWRDEITQLLWSDYIGPVDAGGDPTYTVDGNGSIDSMLSQGAFSWCMASGNTESAGSLDCRAATGGSYNQAAVSLCAEGATLTTPVGGHGSDAPANAIATWSSSGTTVFDAKGGMLKTPSASSPSVEWWLPTRENFFLAYAHGMLYVLPRFRTCGAASYDCKYWTSSICSWPNYGGGKKTAHLFQVNRDGYVQVPDKDRDSNYLVRCVGR